MAARDSSAMWIPELGSCEKYFCELCLVNSESPVDILNHSISAPHTKRLRVHLCLRCQCTACPAYLFDIKAADAHVKDPGHRKKLNCAQTPVQSTDQIYNCLPCGIIFKCSAALELHWVMTHKVAFLNDNLPELMHLNKCLSGSSSGYFKAGVDLECSMCQVKCQAVDDLVLHLLSNAHITALRTSTCLVCDKRFIHVNDREAHLHAYKHKLQLQKACFNSKLKKVNKIKMEENTGYLCMYCMIFCRSWPCYVLHLMGNSHAVYSDCAKKNSLLYENSQAEIEKEISHSLQESQSQWKTWLDQSLGLSVWCSVCEDSVSSPEGLEKHLEGHISLQDSDSRRRQRFLNLLCKTVEYYQLFACEICFLVFKNEFSMLVHKALPQHHICEARILNAGNLCQCFECHLQERFKEVKKLESPFICNGETMGINFPNDKAHDSNISDSFSTDTLQHVKEIVKTEERNNKVTAKSYSEKDSNIKSDCKVLYEEKSTTRNENTTDTIRPSLETDKAFGTMHNTCSHSLLEYEENRKSLPEKCIEIFTDNECNVQQLPGENCKGLGDTMESKENMKTRVIHHGNIKPNDYSDTFAESSCSDKERSSCISKETSMFPIVIAAAVPTSSSFEDGLQSAVDVVSKSLLAAISKIRKHSAQDFEANKRMRYADNSISPNESLHALLEASVSRGLHSLNCISKTQHAFHNCQECEDTKSFAHSTHHNTASSNSSISSPSPDKLAVVFAASVINLPVDEKFSLQRSGSIQNERAGSHEERRENPLSGHSMDYYRCQSFENQNQPGNNFTAYEDDSSDCDVPKIYMSDDSVSESGDEKYFRAEVRCE